MQKIYTSIVLLFAFCATTFGQSPFTITESNFPIFEKQLNKGPITPNNLNFSPSPNGDWDLSAQFSADVDSTLYYPEFDPFFLNEGIDVYFSDIQLLTATLGYLVFYGIDFNDTGVYEKGVYVPDQAYSLGSFTGNPNDSIRFQEQSYIFEEGRQVMQFPATYQSAWHSNSRRAVNFDLSVAALGLNHAPFQHRFTVVRTDSIAGWGKMQINVNGAPSIAYDVLINRVTQHVVDSFFLNGSPAPTQLLAAFGITQGQQNEFSNRYSVYREGYSATFALVVYGQNNFTTPQRMYITTEDVATTSVETPDQPTYTSLLFPNPSRSGELTLQLMGDAPKFDAYTIYNMQGQIVQSGVAQMESGQLDLHMNQQTPNGTYVLHLRGGNGQTLLTQSFELAR